MRRLAGLLLFALLTATCAAAQQDNASLADVAAKKPKQKAARVITNDDIPPSPLAEAADSPQQFSDRASADQNQNDKKAAAAQNAAGSGDVEAIQKQLDTLNKNLSDRETRTAEYKQKLEEETNDLRRDNEQQVLAARQAEEQRMIQQRDQLEKQLAEAKKNDQTNAGQKEQKNDEQKPIEQYDDRQNNPAPFD